MPYKDIRGAAENATTMEKQKGQAHRSRSYYSTRNLGIHWEDEVTPGPSITAPYLLSIGSRCLIIPSLPLADGGSQQWAVHVLRLQSCRSEAAKNAG